MEKRKIFKGLYKDKSFIKMICFTLVLLLVLVLGNSFGYVSADSVGTDLEISGASLFMSYSGYQNSSIYNSSYPSNYQNYFILNSNSLDTDDSVIYSNIIDYVSNNCHSSFENYVILVSNEYSNNMIFSIIYYDNDTVFGFSGGGGFFSASSSGHRVEYFSFQYNGGNITTVRHDLTEIQRGYDDYNGYSFYYLGVSSLTGVPGRVGLSNKPVYAYDNINYSWGGNDTGIWNTCWYLWHNLNNVSGYESSFHDINYYLSDGLVGGSGSGSSGPNAGNYMYADSADWYLSNFNGDIQNKYRTVSAVFTSNLNDFINDSLVLGDSSTDSEYTIDYDFSVFVDFKYSWVLGTSENNVPSVTVGNSYVGASIDFNGNSNDFTDVYYWSCSYECPDAMGNYLTGMHIDASTFADNNYIQEFPLSSLFAYMQPSNSFVINPNGEKTKITITLQQLMYMWANGFIGKNNNLVSEQFTLSNFRLTCKATINYGDAYTDLGHLGQYESGSYSETFDLLTGESYINDDSMLTNYNPYIENTDTDYSQLPSTETGTNSNSTTVTTGNVTQTVTVTNEGASYIPSLINKLLPTSLGDTGTGLVDTFSTMAQTNGWISVMASTVPAIPGTVWNYITDYLGISLYLLACAFVLRLILDLL